MKIFSDRKRCRQELRTAEANGVMPGRRTPPHARLTRTAEHPTNRRSRAAQYAPRSVDTTRERNDMGYVLAGVIVIAVIALAVWAFRGGGPSVGPLGGLDGGKGGDDGLGRRSGGL